MSTHQVMLAFFSLIVITATARGNNPKSPRTIGSNKLVQRPPRILQKQLKDTQNQLSPERTKIEKVYADKLDIIESHYVRKMAELIIDQENLGGNKGFSSSEEVWMTLNRSDKLLDGKVRSEVNRIRDDKKRKAIKYNDELTDRQISELGRIKVAMFETRVDYERDKRHFEGEKEYDLAVLERSERQKKDTQKQINPERTKIERYYSEKLTGVEEHYIREMAELIKDEAELGLSVSLNYPQRRPLETPRRIEKISSEKIKEYRRRSQEISLASHGISLSINSTQRTELFNIWLKRDDILMEQLSSLNHDDKLFYDKLLDAKIRSEGIRIRDDETWESIKHRCTLTEFQVSELRRLAVAKFEARADYERDKRYFEKKKEYDLAKLEKSEQRINNKQTKRNHSVATNTIKTSLKIQQRGLVTGIVLGDKPFAIINGEIVQPGQTVNGIKILNISKIA